MQAEIMVNHQHTRFQEQSEEEISFSDSASPRKYLPPHIKIMKVALAMAIIRQKPEGVSVREYTERLALQVSQLQLDWRDRAVQLQQELLRTRQELAKFQVQAETLTNIRTGVIQDSDSEWVSSSGYSSSAPTPGAETGGGTTHEVARRERREEKSLSSDTNKTERIAVHVKFLSSVSSILSASQNLSILTESDLQTTVRDTILQATRGLTEVVGSSSSLPSLPTSLTNLQKATETIVETVLAPRMQLFRQEMVEVCSGLLQSITTRILCHRQHPKTEYEVLCTLICTLCLIPPLYWEAVQQLTTAILECAHMLSCSTQDVSLLDTNAIQTAANVFKTLEALCTKYDTSTLPRQMCLGLSKELEDSVMEINTTYPLFTFSVWRLLAHLASTQT